MDLSKLNDLWMELALEEEETQKKGMVFVADMGGLPMRIIKFLTPIVTIKCAIKEEVRVQFYCVARDVSLRDRADTCSVGSFRTSSICCRNFPLHICLSSTSVHALSILLLHIILLTLLELAWSQVFI
jgi:hypothetical protein